LLSKDKKYNRRFFFKSALAGITVAMIAVWDKMLFTNNRIHSLKSITLTFNPNKKINFAGNYIIIKNDDTIRVFSSRCTHLGCKINESRENQILCPCHGSTYNIQGIPTKGPAIKPLEEKDFVIDKEKNIITISI